MGPPGPPGPLAEGGMTIIPFASGEPIELSTNSNGTANRAGLIGFGNSGNSPRLVDNTIDLTNDQGLTNFAFSMPRDGIINNISAHFTPTGFGDGAGVDIVAQLYSAPVNTNVFSPIVGTKVMLTPTGNPSRIRSGIVNNLEIPVEVQTRLLMVFLAEASRKPLHCNQVGYASAGLAIK